MVSARNQQMRVGKDLEPIMPVFAGLG